MKKIFLISKLNFQKWLTNPRIYVIALLLIALLKMMLQGVTEFTSDVNEPATIWAFPFLTSTVFSLMIMMFGIVLLYCDAPFFDNQSSYIILRAGKKSWVLGQIIYIIIATFIYFIFIFLITIIILLPNISFENEWGQIWNTISQTDAGSKYEIMLSTDYAILNQYTPIRAFVWSFCTSWLIGILIGLIMFVLNYYFNRAIGAIICTLMVLMHPFTLDASGYFMYYLSPVSWASLIVIDGTNTTPRPSMLFVLVTLITLIFILSTLILLNINKKNIEILPHI